MRLPGFQTLVSAAILAILTGPAPGQTLYLAEQEIDSSDDGVMKAAIGRCAELAAASPDARTAASFTRKPPAAPIPPAETASGDEQAVVNPATLSLGAGEDGSVAGVPEEEDTAEAEGAGEEAVTAPLPSGDATDSSEEIDLEGVTLEDCKEAGLVY